jgi:hypothetical protein
MEPPSFHGPQTSGTAPGEAGDSPEFTPLYYDSDPQAHMRGDPESSSGWRVKAPFPLRTSAGALLPGGDKDGPSV